MFVKKFKTNITEKSIANLATLHLQRIIPDFLIDFDLRHTDHIMSLKGNREVSTMVIEVMTTQGFDCQPLPH